MNETFTIKSSKSDRQLIFYDHEVEYFRVKLEGGLKASIRVYNYAPHDQKLASWFDDLANQNSPWKGELSWQSLEGEFKIEAVCDSLGHITFTIYLADIMGANEESYIQAGIETEFGQIERIAAEAKLFFGT